MTSSAEPTIRPIRREDRAAWEPLWRGYQAFYRTDIPAATTEVTFGRFFDPVEPMRALVAEGEGGLVGLVHFIYHRSTWTVGPYCYLQDLFTAEAARGRGVATALIRAVEAEARRDGCSRLYWLTHETNATGIRLYEKLADRSGFIQFRKLF